MTSMCPHCHNFTLYCTCRAVTTSGGTTTWIGPYTAPEPAPMLTITPQLTEEQVRTIVREELTASKHEIVQDAIQELVKQIRLRSGVRT